MTSYQMRVFRFGKPLIYLSPCRKITSGSPVNSERRHKIKGWSYVNQSMIESCAAKPSVKVTPFQMLNAGKFSDGAHLIKNVQFLQKELVTRIAGRLVAFHSLPYIVGVNPDISDTYELYIRSFDMLSQYPKGKGSFEVFLSFRRSTASNDQVDFAFGQVKQVKDVKSERKYSKMVRSLLDDHRHVVTSLARGFKDCKHQVPYETIHSFLDNTLKSRLGIRMLAEHHIALREEKENFVGIIATDLSLKTIIERSADFVSDLEEGICVTYRLGGPDRKDRGKTFFYPNRPKRQICEHHYGVCPGIVINGHTDASFPYFPAPLEYMLQELLKNAMRSTVEFHSGKYTFKTSSLPSVKITICNNDTDFRLRIADQGGGIPDSIIDEIFHYSFTTFKKETNVNVLSQYSQSVNTSETIGSMAGFGFGLPTSRAYAEFLGGSVRLQTMPGYGTDVYIKLKKIDGDSDNILL